MSDVAKRLLAHGLFSRSLLSGCTKMYWDLAGMDDDMDRRLLDEFCCIRPPFPKLWVEGDDWACAVKQVGDAVSITPFSIADYSAARGAARTMQFEKDGSPVGDIMPEAREGANLQWPIDRLTEMPLVRGDRIKATKDFERRMVEKYGSLDAALGELNRELAAAEVERSAKIREWNGAALLFAVRCTVLVLSFLNCKNVGLVDESAPRARRRQLQRDGLGSVYKVLSVRGFGGGHVSQGSGDGERMTRLHLVRGHFATWTAERPLFGKYSGTWWVSAHARGDKERGTIAKAYAVKP